MTADEKADGARGIGNRRAACVYCLARLAQERVGHRGMKADRRAVADLPVANVRDRAVEAEFARDDLLGEVAGADEIRDDVNLRGARLPQRLAKIGFFLPETDVDLGEDAAPPQFLRMLVGGRAGIGIECRAMPEQQQRRFAERRVHRPWTPRRIRRATQPPR